MNLAAPKTRFRPTLNAIFIATLLGLALLLAAIFYLFFRGSRDSILEFTDKLRDNASVQIAARTDRFFRRAEDSLADIERRIKLRAVTLHSPLDIEPVLYAEVLANNDIADVAFVYAQKTGHDAAGNAILSPDGRGEIDVTRDSNEQQPRVTTRHIHSNGTAFVSDVRRRPAGGDFISAAFASESGDAPKDPTLTDWFSTSASDEFLEKAIWSDLYACESPVAGENSSSRACVTVQKSITDSGGRFLGVLKAALSTGELTRIINAGLNGDNRSDPHRIFLCDFKGRLIVPLSPDDEKESFPEGIRFTSTHAPREIRTALGLPQLARVDRQNVTESAAFMLDGERYLATFRALASTQDWIVGIVVPESVYLGGLREARMRILFSALAAMLLILVGGILTIRLLKRDLGTIVAATARMRNFEFSPSRSEPVIDDVHHVMDRLEQAKTAMRSMSKYVPVALVRQLYEMRAEPALGSELLEISMMFSDVKDFTTLSEQLTPDELAHALGRYLQVMTGAIHAQRGTVDKFIGDAVMTLWNVPQPVPGHAALACQAALDCRRLLEQLFTSPEWKTLPRFDTRFGVHKDRVMVGHFGAPDRMNYTAMGDGVNLASRLEGLNKVYGTSILVSDVVAAECRDRFAFRLIDIVAVKGKSKGVTIYELLDTASAANPPAPCVTAYEAAFRHYQQREFARALALLEVQLDDAPSAVLAERCRHLQIHPPSAEWTGVYVATSK